MPRLTQAQKNTIKQKAPDVPPDTCPYIDWIIQAMDDIPEASPADDARLKMIKETLEYIRTCNETLRESSFYWYKEWSKN